MLAAHAQEAELVNELVVLLFVALLSFRSFVILELHRIVRMILLAVEQCLGNCLDALFQFRLDVFQLFNFLQPCLLVRLVSLRKNCVSSEVQSLGPRQFGVQATELVEARRLPAAAF